MTEFSTTECSEEALFHALARMIVDIPVEDIGQWRPSSTKTLMQLANSEKISARLGCRFPRNLLPESPFAEMWPYFASVAMQNRVRNDQLLKHILDISKTLSAANVPCVFLKGAALLANSVCDSSSSRHISDIDCLVNEAQLQVAVDTLQSLGYAIPFPPGPIRLYTSKYARHYPPMMHTDSGIIVELHIRLDSDNRESVLSADDVFRNVESILVSGVAIQTPSLEDRITHLIAHTQITDKQYALGYFKLRYMAELVDLHRTHGNLVDWEYIRRRFQAVNQETALDSFLIATKKYSTLEITTCKTTTQTSRYLQRLSRNLCKPMSKERQLLRLRMLKLKEQFLNANFYQYLWGRIVWESERRLGIKSK